MHPRTNTYLPTNPDAIDAAGRRPDEADRNPHGAGPARPRLGADLATGGLAVLAALFTWGAWTQLAGVDLTAHSGDAIRTVGAVGVAASTVLIALAGIGSLRFLEKRWQRGVTAWTVLAVAILVLSFPGPVGATSVAAGLGLASLHLVVGVVLLVGLRRPR